MACRLSVNLNKIALIRNARGRDYPSLSYFARLALQAGATGVTIHPRPDQRHARYSDIAALAAVVREFPKAELNVEGYPDPIFLQEVLAVRPAQCTLVPDTPGQLTSDHGWSIADARALLTPMVAQLKAAGIRTSLFMNPDAAEIAVVPQTGANRIELYTEAYARQANATTIALYQQAARQASASQLGVNAGHDLNLDNLAYFLQALPEVEEVSIGHALTVEALEAGFVPTIKRYLQIIHKLKS